MISKTPPALTRDELIQLFLSPLSCSYGGAAEVLGTKDLIRLARTGYLELYGRTVMQGGHAILISGDMPKLVEELEGVYVNKGALPFNPADSSESWAHLAARGRPKVYNGNYDNEDPSKGPLIAPLETVVLLLDSPRKHGLIKVPERKAVWMVSGYSGDAFPEETRTGLRALLGRVNVVGYVPESGESGLQIYQTLPRR